MRLAIVASAALSLCAVNAAGGESPTGLKPLTEPGFYEVDGKRYERGLYPGGKNEMPEAHRRAGERIAQTIVPLTSGKPDPTRGRVVIGSIGHSCPLGYFKLFGKHIEEKKGAGEVSPRLYLVNACVQSTFASTWIEKIKNGDTRLEPDMQVLFSLVTFHGASRSLTERGNPGMLRLPFDQKLPKMKEQLKEVVQLAARKHPHLKMVFLGSDTWRGNRKLEPEAYQEGFAVKLLIEDQISGDPELAFEGPDRKAPWLAWGGYIWEANAPRERFISDGVHPSDIGKAFAVKRWYEALAGNSAARPWFLNAAKAAANGG